MVMSQRALLRKQRIEDWETGNGMFVVIGGQGDPRSLTVNRRTWMWWQT